MSASLNEAQREVVSTLKAHWRLYVFEGVVMIVLGVLAIIFPVFATLAVDLYLGWLFLFCGVLALIAMISAGTFRASGGRSSPQSWRSWWVLRSS